MPGFVELKQTCRMRPAQLHLSALSPHEFDSYEPWFRMIESEQATRGRFTHIDLWSFVRRMVLPGQTDSAREPEVCCAKQKSLKEKVHQA